MFENLESGIKAIQAEIAKQIPDEHALYVKAQGRRYLHLKDEEPFDLTEAVSKFLRFEKNEASSSSAAVSETDPKVLLLMGDAGSGKSLFCQDLVLQLWKDYQPGKPIPLFISLPTLNDPVHHAIDETLLAYGFTEEQIQQLKQQQQFIFILDGYDEIHQWKNLYVTNHLESWQAKTIITCRSQSLYKDPDWEKYFMPFQGEKRQPWLLEQLYVSPFSNTQIESYLKQYQRQQDRKSTRLNSSHMS